ncbi:MAG TPA: hypothetical protein VGS22_02270 [Thermoanaerobaculia bacterium]|nr:hypothetical protein [Thermoanaerobaculia bacterium]
MRTPPDRDLTDSGFETTAFDGRRGGSYHARQIFGGYSPVMLLELRPRYLSVCLLAGITLALAAPAQGATSTLTNPIVVFATPGSKQVSLQSCNAAGCDSEIKTVTVLNALPSVVSATVNPGAVQVGEMVQLIGSGAGAPPLTYTWKIFSGAGLIATLPGATAWWDTLGQPAGPYTAQLSVGNTFGLVQSATMPVAVQTYVPPNFFTLSPCRVLDTRNTTPLVSGVARSVALAAAACGVPATAKAISANLSVTTPSGSGLVVLYPGNYPRPGTQSLNFGSGQTRTNNIVIALASDGSSTLNAEATMTAGGGTVQFILDVNGYFE